MMKKQQSCFTGRLPFPLTVFRGLVWVYESWPLTSLTRPYCPLPSQRALAHAIKVQAHGHLEVLTIILLVHMAASGNHHDEEAAFRLQQNSSVPLEEPQKIIRQWDRGGKLQEIMQNICHYKRITLTDAKTTTECCSSDLMTWLPDAVYCVMDLSAVFRIAGSENNLCYVNICL